MVSHQSAYTLDEPGSELSAFHVQWLWPTLRDLAERAGYKRCTDQKCGFTPSEIIEIRLGWESGLTCVSPAVSDRSHEHGESATSPQSSAKISRGMADWLVPVQAPHR